jgi:hypothetical protein
MKTHSVRTFAAVFCCFGIATFATAIGDSDSVVTAVFSRSFNGYERPAGPDGRPALQTYVVAKGGYEPGLGSDPSIDNVKFAGVVRILGKYLASQGYFPAKDAKKADVMLVIHWGKTIPFNDATHQNMLDRGLQGFEGLQQLGLGIGSSPIPSGRNSEAPPSAATFSPDQSRDQVEAALAEAARSQMIQGVMEIRMAQQIRDNANVHNANLLGYSAELSARDNPSLFAGAGTSYHDLIADLETERYYVAVTAYDFQDALQHNTNKGLWRTVTSIEARGNRFDEKLRAMVEKGSRYFGQDSGRLVRQFDRTPRVSIGDLKMLGVVEEESSSKN